MTENLIQGSQEWRAARLGRVTASRVADAVARTKTSWGASRANYMAELIAERLTGEPAATYQNAAMAWGTEHEAEAIAAYSFRHDAEVEAVGFIPHPSISMTGASPDGLVGADGLVEVKCPQTATHIDTLLGDPIDRKYLLQMHWQMACTGRAWCDFLSFDPRLPESMRLFVQRVPRDQTMIVSLERDIAEFLDELDGRVAALRERYERKAA